MNEPETGGAGQPRCLVLSVNASWNVYNFRRGLVRHLQEQGYEIVVAAPRDDYSDRLAELGCRYVPLPINSRNTSPVEDIRLFLSYRRLFREERPVAYLGFTAKPNIYGSLAARLAGIPAINNISGLGTAFIRRNWVSHVVRLLYRVGLSGSHTVFFQNADDRDLFVDSGLVKARRASLLPGSGVDLTRFQMTPLPHAAGDDVHFLLIGRLIRDKGVGEFVDAARIVRKVCPQARFSLLGFLDVDNVSAISRRDIDAWEQAGIVRYLGKTDDVRPHIAAADCVVLPSYREGTPKTLLEAAAMGRPLIATDVPGCREVVDDAENGFLCRVRDSASLADQMIRFIELSPSARERQAAASREMVESRFDEKIVLSRYADAVAAAGAVRP